MPPRESSCGTVPGCRRRGSPLLDDLLGIGDPEIALPQIDPDARRRRLAAMVKAAVIARATPTAYVIEDAHWIDEVSESMLAELLTVVPRTRSLVSSHIGPNTPVRLLMRPAHRRCTRAAG